MSRVSNKIFYERAIKQHGYTAKGLHWHSKQTQEVRFEVIASFLEKEGLESLVIADAGCGFGDFYLYLHAQKLRPLQYIGIDVMASFVEMAQKRLARFSNCTLTCKDILKDSLPYADWYVSSGALNILSDFNTWLFIENMLLHARKGVIFNMLQGEEDNGVFNYKEKEEVIAFLEEKGLEYELVEGYLERDMSVKIYV